ncbi:MAG: RloB family protein [Acidobacteria bacterium]|nr:RloB family protein [Acidobacteriota bacterium]
MASRRFRDSRRSLYRRQPSLDPRPRILVVCEGIVTEPQYFEAFKREEGNRLVDVMIDNQGGVPKTLVERAALLKKLAEREALREHDDNLKYDEVWCVFDVDQHPKLADARQQARDNGIKLAVSNPCFELWLLIHFTDQTAHIERKRAATALKKYIREYDKHVPFEILRSGYMDAVRRAQLIESRCIEEGGNPSTGVYLLTERIREFGRRERTYL